MQWRDRDIQIKTWNNEKLGKLIACDTETEFKPFYMTPEIITCQVYDGSDTVYYIPLNKLFLFFNKQYNSTFIFHNAPFDLDVLGLKINRIQYDLLDRDKVRDTNILYKLLHLATAGYVPFKSNLNFLSEKYLNETLDKESDIRTSFEQFKGLPISDIPKEYLEYGAKDVLATFDLYLVLISHIKQYDKFNTLLSHNIQVKGDLALNHIHKNGIGFDLNMRDEWLKDIDSKIQEQADILATWGWARGLKGVNDRYEQALEYSGIKHLLPTTESGQVSSSSKDLEPYKDLPFVSAYLKFNELEKASSFVRDLSSDRIHPKYNILVNTGRTSCSKPNFQQLPKLGGIREMFRASEGNTFIITDYNAIELSTLAQVTYDMFGQSVMREKINDGKDLHYYYSSVLFSKPESEISKDERGKAKAANFGFPGGLGIDTFIEFSKGYGLDLSPSEAQDMKDTWFNAFPEMTPYMRNEVGQVYSRTGRLRGNTSYCAEKNTPFQGLAADGAKLALYNLDKRGYKIVGFIHDEIVCEVPKNKVDKLLKPMEDIMVNSMREVVPDVSVGVESMISEVFTK